MSREEFKRKIEQSYLAWHECLMPADRLRGSDCAEVRRRLQHG